MSLQNKYKRTPKEAPQKRGSSEVVSQIVSNDEKDIKKSKKATFLLDEELHKKLRVYAAMNDTTMLDVVERALNKYLEK